MQIVIVRCTVSIQSLQLEHVDRFIDSTYVWIRYNTSMVIFMHCTDQESKTLYEFVRRAVSTDILDIRYKCVICIHII